MKTCLILLLVSFILPISTRAELLIYRETERAKITGNGREFTVPVVTYVVHDLNSGKFSALGLLRFGSAKYYLVTNDTPGYVVTRGISGLGNYTVISRTSGTNDDPDVITSIYFAKGRDSVLKTSTNSTTNFPRTLKAVNRSVQFSSGILATYESSSSLTFQATDTAVANNAGDTAAIVIERLRQRFAAQGYVPNP